MYKSIVIAASLSLMFSSSSGVSGEPENIENNTSYQSETVDSLPEETWSIEETIPLDNDFLEPNTILESDDSVLANDIAGSSSTFLRDMTSRVRSLGGSNVIVKTANIVCGSSANLGCAQAPNTITFANRLSGYSDAYKWYAAAHEFGHIKHFANYEVINSHSTYRNSFGSNPELLADCIARYLGKTVPATRSCNATQLNFAKLVFQEKIGYPRAVFSKASIIGSPVVGATLKSSVSQTVKGAKWSVVSYSWFADGVKVGSSSSYKVKASDANKELKLRVQVKDDQWGHGAFLTTTVKILPKLGVSKINRYGGKDRYESAAKVSNNSGPVFLVSGQNFPDALSATSPAVKEEGNILLTQRSSLPNATRKALLAQKNSNLVYIIGGSGVINSSVEKQVKSLGKETIRIGGKDRYETNILVNKRFFPNRNLDVYIATGQNYPDALVLGSVAASKRHPLILVNGKAKKPNAKTRNFLKGMEARNLRVAGGQGAISKGYFNSLKSDFYFVQRYSGANRYETAATLIRYLMPKEQYDSVWIASGQNYPDALTASVPSGRNRVPLVLTKSKCMPRETYSVLSDIKVKTLNVAGGAGAVTTNSATGKTVCR